MSYWKKLFVVVAAEVWKNTERVSEHPLAGNRPVHKIDRFVSFRVPVGGLEKFTRFLIVNVIKKLLS
jgi:hypothetical protein